MGASLVFLLYLSPRRASAQIDRLVVSSTRELESLPKDVVVERNDISLANFQRTRIYDPGRGFVRGSMFTLALKNGQKVIFANTLDTERLGRLLQLFQRFTAPDPAIDFPVE